MDNKKNESGIDEITKNVCLDYSTFEKDVFIELYSIKIRNLEEAKALREENIDLMLDAVECLVYEYSKCFSDPVFDGDCSKLLVKDWNKMYYFILFIDEIRGIGNFNERLPWRFFDRFSCEKIKQHCRIILGINKNE